MLSNLNLLNKLSEVQSLTFMNGRNSVERGELIL